MTYRKKIFTRFHYLLTNLLTLVIAHASNRLLQATMKQSKVIVCQNEIPLKCTIKALQIARKYSLLGIFNCAPALPLVQLEDAINSCDILCPNETELSVLTGVSTGTNEDIVHASLIVLDKCPGCK